MTQGIPDRRQGLHHQCLEAVLLRLLDLDSRPDHEGGIRNVGPLHQPPQRRRPEETGLDALPIRSCACSRATRSPSSSSPPPWSHSRGGTAWAGCGAGHRVPTTRAGSSARVYPLSSILHRFTVVVRPYTWWCSETPRIFPALPTARHAWVVGLPVGERGAIWATVDPAAGGDQRRACDGDGVPGPTLRITDAPPQPGDDTCTSPGCGRAARCPPRRRGGPGGRGLPGSGRPHHSACSTASRR